MCPGGPAGKPEDILFTECVCFPFWVDACVGVGNVDLQQMYAELQGARSAAAALQ